MDGWNKIQTSIAGLNLGNQAKGLARGFSTSVQATRERLGQVAADEITELPQEYKDLEARVDALKQTHVNLLKITRVYESEAYDYPTQVQESVSELTQLIGHNVTSFASTNLKGTNIPVPQPTPAPVSQHKTLPHALVRASSAGAAVLGPSDSLGKALTLYRGAWEKIATARLQQDEEIRQHYLQPWQTTLNNSIALANKARTAVRQSRLELDSAKQALKSAGPQKQEQARLDVENCEDDLVQKTEVAITLMKTVLDNPEPIKNMNALAKAQMTFFTAAAEALTSVQGEIEDISVSAEGQYRKSRDH